MCFGERLKLIRKEKGLTLERLAASLNTSETVLRNYEKSRRMPNTEMLVRLCNVLEVSPNYLLQDEVSSDLTTKELFEKISFLTPSQREFLDDFLSTLLKRNDQ